jgi:hypothetical protein
MQRSNAAPRNDAGAAALYGLFAVHAALIKKEIWMIATAQATRPPSRTLFCLEGRALQEFGAFVAALPLLSRAPRGDGHPVLVFHGIR